MRGKIKLLTLIEKMTPEQIEKILESNSKAIASNSDTIAELRKQTQTQIEEARKQTQAQIAESQRQINALYQLNAELVRDRSTMIEIIRGLNEDRVSNSENIATIAENISRISQTNIEQNEILAKIAKSLENRSE